MTAAGGIDAKADIPANMKIYFLLLFSPISLSLPPSILLLLFLFDTWGGFNLSSCWGLADWLAGGSQGPTWYALSMSVCVCVCVRVHIAYTTVSADWGRAARLIRAASWAWLTRAGPSQAVRAVALRGGPFHLHCPSQGSPSRGPDRGEAGVLLELEAGGGGEKGRLHIHESNTKSVSVRNRLSGGIIM